jgi:uncharacterized membrane protein
LSCDSSVRSFVVVRTFLLKQYFKRLNIVMFIFNYINLKKRDDSEISHSSWTNEESSSSIDRNGSEVF